MSSAQLWITGRTEKMKQPARPTATISSQSDPIDGKAKITTQDPTKPTIRMGLRPIRSDSAPANGVATAPPTCSTMTMTPSQ